MKLDMQKVFNWVLKLITVDSIIRCVSLKLENTPFSKIINNNNNNNNKYNDQKKKKISEATTTVILKISFLPSLTFLILSGSGLGWYSEPFLNSINRI